MGALPIITDTVRIAFNWGDTSPKWTNVMHFRSTDTTPDEYAAAMAAAMQADMWALTSSDFGVLNFTVTPLDGSSATHTYPGAGSQMDGSSTRGGDWIPAFAGVVKLTTAKRGRSYRGRIYLGGIDEGSQANGVLNSTDVARAQSSWNGFAFRASANGADFVVASYKHATAEGVTAVTVEGLGATQRRRQTRIRQP